MGVSGGDGNDRLIGGSNNDTLIGGDACCLYQDNDTLIGGPGDDTLNLGSDFGFDIVEESGDVNFTLTNTQLTGRGTDTFVGTANGVILTGGARQQRLERERVHERPGDARRRRAGSTSLQGGSQADIAHRRRGERHARRRRERDAIGCVETADANMTLSDGVARRVRHRHATRSTNVELATLNGGRRSRTS